MPNPTRFPVASQRYPLALASRHFGAHHRDWIHLSFWIVMGALVIGVIILLVALLIPASPPLSKSADTAEALLAKRFARGEIDEAEFRARRDALRS